MFYVERFSSKKQTFHKFVNGDGGCPGWKIFKTIAKERGGGLSGLIAGGREEGGGDCPGPEYQFCTLTSSRDYDFFPQY